MFNCIEIVFEHKVLEHFASLSIGIHPDGMMQRGRAF
jgi:hypothetical protein